MRARFLGDAFGVLCLNAKMLSVDLWQYCESCIRSDVTRRTLSLVSTCAVCASEGYTGCAGRTSVYLCSSSLQNLAVLKDSRYSSGTILLTAVFDAVRLTSFKSRANAFHWQKQLYPFLSSIFPFLYILSLDWYCGDGVFSLIVCKSLSPSLVMPTSFNNNNNNNNNK